MYDNCYFEKKWFFTPNLGQSMDQRAHRLRFFTSWTGFIKKIWEISSLFEDKKIKDFPCSLKAICVCYWSSSFTCTSVLDSCREKGRYLGEVNAIYYHARPTCMLQFSLRWIKRDNSKSTVHLAPHLDIDCKKSIL